MPADIYLKVLLVFWMLVLSFALFRLFHNQYDDIADDRVADELPRHYRCEPINIAFCKNIGYNLTIMPNLLDQVENQEEAASKILFYFPVFKVKYSPADIQFFLCTVYVPVCTILNYPILPCRSLCLSVKNGYERIFNTLNYKWPDHLNCDNFPEEGPEVLCVNKNTY